MEIVLASASPRRQELLRQVGVSFTVCPSGVDERVDRSMAPGELVEHLALAKARDVAARRPNALVLGSDTVVVLDDAVLGKPADQSEALAILSRLSGRVHRVYTGVALIRGDEKVTAHECTEVRFRVLDPAEIAAYIASGEPMDKAGAYGIQGLGAALVEGIVGDYFTVVGLPLCRTVQLLAQFGVKVL